MKRHTGGRQDDLLERAFWSSLTSSPPVYGADNPVSFFDEHLPWGWNLRDLQDLLHVCNCPDIPGVTSPMTYFGMWKVSPALQLRAFVACSNVHGTHDSVQHLGTLLIPALQSKRQQIIGVPACSACCQLPADIKLFCVQSFFSWHVEDVDLYSVNYLHFGAPKVGFSLALSACHFCVVLCCAQSESPAGCIVLLDTGQTAAEYSGVHSAQTVQIWYCVSPKDRKRFEKLARSMFSQESHACAAFMRHKDILFSPKSLRSNGIEYTVVRMGPHVVLTPASALHVGGWSGCMNCSRSSCLKNCSSTSTSAS